MRILLLSPFLPSVRSDHGGGRLLFEMIEHLSQRHEVGLICFSDQRDLPGSVEMLGNLCRILKVVPKDIYHLEKRKRLVNLFSFAPSWCLHTHSDRVVEFLDETLKDFSPDIVQIEFLLMAHYVTRISHPRVVLNIHEAFARNWFLKAIEYRRSPIMGYILWDFWKWARHEKGMVGRFREVLALSAEDRRYLSAANPGASVSVWRPGMNLKARIEGRDASEGKEHRLLFVGSFSHYPNVDGLRFFCKRILPKIVEAGNRVVLDVVGSNPPPVVRALHGETVRVHGYVEDLEACYGQTDVVIVPIRFGGGVRMKLLEALAHGLPVVATVPAAQGIDGTDGEHFFVVSDPHAFASRVGLLLSDPVLRRTMGEKARKFIEKTYSWPLSIQRLEAIYERILGNDAAGRRDKRADALDSGPKGEPVP